ncbi:hypothetical protein LJC14_01805 [Treponema sp. OttesenSCG-928-L16]|nr:hypothetical protein [Treponema sp. OttesenSCG-928-L16]
MILYTGWNLSDRFLLGFKITTGSDLREINYIEGAALFRWYFLQRGTLSEQSRIPRSRRMFFVQADAGAGIYSAAFGSQDVKPSAVGEVTAGLRFYFLWGRDPVFIEPYIQYGYPSGIGIGFAMGV